MPSPRSVIWPVKASGTTVPSTSVPARTSMSRWPDSAPAMAIWPKLPASKFTVSPPLPARLARLALPPAPLATTLPSPLTAPTAMLPPRGCSSRPPAPPMLSTRRLLFRPSVARRSVWPARSMLPLITSSVRFRPVPVAPSTARLASPVRLTGPDTAAPGTGPNSPPTMRALLLSVPASAIGRVTLVTTLEVTICSSPPLATLMPLVPARPPPATPRVPPVATVVAPLKLLVPDSTSRPLARCRPAAPLMLPRRNSWLAVLPPPCTVRLLPSCRALSTEAWPLVVCICSSGSTP